MYLTIDTRGLGMPNLEGGGRSELDKNIIELDITLYTAINTLFIFKLLQNQWLETVRT